MKKALMIISLLGLFILVGNKVSAQSSEKVIQKIDTDTKTAVLTINKDKSLDDEQKERFIQRLETFAETAKRNEDAKAMEIYEKEYSRIAENYNRVTGNTLPKLNSGK